MAVAAALLAASGPSHASHPWTPTLRWADFEPGGDGGISYSFCVPDAPTEWSTAIEQRWDTPLVHWSFNYTGAGTCNGQTRVFWESPNRECPDPGWAACWRPDPLAPPVWHGAHQDLKFANILVDGPKWDPMNSTWNAALMAHEWGHNMGLTDHDLASQEAAGTLMNHIIEDPPTYGGPTQGDLSSAKCTHNWICHTPGVWRAGWWFLRYSNSTGSDGNALADTSFPYGDATDRPLAGDWDRDGDETAGVYRPSNATFYLSNNNIQAAITVGYGNGGDIPLTGDWDGDGDDTIGVYRPSNRTFYLSNNNSTAAITVAYGNGGDIPLSGDWDGDGDDNIGVYRPSNATFYLSINNSTAWYTAQYGNLGDTPMTGDWNASGNDTIGVWRGGWWYLHNSNYPGQADITYPYGADTDTPMTGDWR